MKRKCSIVGVLFFLIHFYCVNAVDLEQVGRTAAIAHGLYSAMQGQEKTEPKGLDTLMKDAKKQGFSQEVQLNALLELAQEKNDPVIAERVRTLIRQRDKQEIKGVIHKYGIALILTQLAIGGMIYYLGNRVLDNLEGRHV